MLMRIALLLLLTSCWAFCLDPDSVSATPFSCSKDTARNTIHSPEDGILESIQKRYEEIESIEATFEQSSYLAALEVAETSRGRVSFLRPGMIRFDYDTPEKQNFLIRDNKFTHYQPEQFQARTGLLEEFLVS